MKVEHAGALLISQSYDLMWRKACSESGVERSMNAAPSP
jgi:hypothetical protein